MLKTLKYFYGTAWRERPFYLLFLLASILLNAGQPFINLILSKYLLEELVGDRNTEILLWIVAGIVIGNLLFLSLIHVVRTNLAKYDDWFERYFYDRLSLKSMTMDYPLTENPETLNQRRKADEGMAWYSGGMKGLSESIQLLFSYALILAGVVSIVAVMSPVLLIVALFAVIGGTFTVWQTGKIQKIEFEKFPKVNRAFGYATRNILEVKFAKSIRLYHGAPMMREQFVNTTKKCSDIFYYTANSIGRWNCVGSFVNFLKGLCIYGYLSYKLLTGTISIGDFTLLAGASNSLKDSLQGLLNQFQEVHRKLNFMREYVKFIDTEDMHRLGTQAISEKELPVIEFRNVSFRYPSMQDYILKDINITISPGQHLSVVGLNGAGKTTFIKLLCRLYDVDEGEILLNGVNIKSFDYDSYIKELAVVFQDFKMFALSIRENMKLGDWEKEVQERDMKNICALSGLTQKVESLSKGIDTQIYKYFDKEGIEPSGGEMQKLAIARALYKDAPVVILDEPTAALDPIAEYDIYRQFDTLIGGKTAIYISHRLSSCKFCDKIAVFADNTIKEYGTHEELANLPDGIYAEMFKAQARYYA
jgi:ABC-type multidrug transport system fused ATPase/permease subunit